MNAVSSRYVGLLYAAPAILFVLFTVYLATRRSDDEEEPSGHCWTIFDALIHLLSWW